MADGADSDFEPRKGFFVKDFDEATGSARKQTQTRVGAPPKKQKPLPPWKDGVISAWATNLYDVSGKLVEGFDVQYGIALQTIAVPAGNAWEGVAKSSPQLRRIIHTLMTTTKMSELIMAHVPLVIVVMHKHGPMRDVFNTVAENMAEEMSSTPTNGFTPHAAAAG